MKNCDLTVSQRGITLIESLIAITISGILLSLAISSYRAWIQNSQVRTAAESVLNGLQLTRTEAASRNTPVSFTLTGNDWSVDVIPDATYGIAAKNVQRRSGTEGSANAAIAASQNSVVFDGLGRVVPIPATDILFAVTNPSAGNCASTTGNAGVRCINVTVSTGGQVRMCDPALQLSVNPQGCL